MWVCCCRVAQCQRSSKTVCSTCPSGFCQALPHAELSSDLDASLQAYTRSLYVNNASREVYTKFRAFNPGECACVCLVGGGGVRMA